MSKLENNKENLGQESLEEETSKNNTNLFKLPYLVGSGILDLPDESFALSDGLGTSQKAGFCFLHVHC